MRIAVASDHAGFAYKTMLADMLRGLGHEVVDFGTTSEQPVDYPDFVEPAARAVARGDCERGIVLGGSGNGEAMAANRVAGARCALCWSEETARLARAHNDANMISLGQRLLAEGEARAIVRSWLATPFDAGRHARRIGKLDARQDRWTAVDRYLDGLFAPDDPALRGALERCAAAGLPPHQVSPGQGKLLLVLARAVGARRILEVGTLGGYGAIWLARALPPDGRLVTLEAEPARAALARDSLARAGLAERVEVRAGPAAGSLAELHAEGAGPFDLVFLDADKPGNPEYLSWALRLTRPGSLLVADNVVRGGAVTDAGADDERVRGVRRFLALLADEPRVTATVVQTVGSKGWDGFALALVGDGETPRSPR